MKWPNNYLTDLRRYRGYSRGPLWVQFLAQQGLWALLQFRLASAVFNSAMPSFFKKPTLILFIIWQKLIEILTGISIPYTARIGEGLYIGHFGNIIINGDAEIGSFCNLAQGVTIGVSGRGENRGVPKIGDHVYVGANAVIAGRINIGNDVVIAANSLVHSNVPDHCTVMGVPAVIVNQKNSRDYIHPKSS